MLDRDGYFSAVNWLLEQHEHQDHEQQEQDHEQQEQDHEQQEQDHEERWQLPLPSAPPRMSSP
jgi:hypothetical protein